MVLWLIGLGLGDEGDITVKGLEVVKKSDYVYLESYTSVLPGLGREELARAYGVSEILEADRDLVESGCEEMLERSKPADANVAFLVVGDALCATTHTDIWLRARKLGIDVRVVHNASVMSAIAACGLQLYRFGEAISICYWDNNWKPDSYYDKIVRNRQMGLHTLCLLDIKVKERSMENLMKGRDIFEPPRFMSVQEAVQQLREIEETKQQGVATADSELVGVARLGRPDQAVVFGKCSELAELDMGAPLHSLVVPAPELHECETEFLELQRPPRAS
eukprot:TRINITY_DN47852_c0_g1_i1.p1 TRINITY_DN47852_c0_g1~~TRINITY_DN47852_c0_g1_i1.p1  ORF type:complete len:317 (-),score=64.90 TRINITY_DN47852_c0_g1_i1:65-898(-)